MWQFGVCEEHAPCPFDRLAGALEIIALSKDDSVTHSLDTVVTEAVQGKDSWLDRLAAERTVMKLGEITEMPMAKTGQETNIEYV